VAALPRGNRRCFSAAMRARWHFMCRSACRTCRSAIWMSSANAINR